MYAKVFRQMYEGTLATTGPWEALVTFQQLLVLANDNGDVDMTPAVISRMTTIPLEVIEVGLRALSDPDPQSRTPDEEGRRIVLLSSQRSWGWRIVNYLKYRAIQKEAERREYHRNYYHQVRKQKPDVEMPPAQHSQQLSTHSTRSTDTEEEAEEEVKRNTRSRALSVSDLVAEGVDRTHAQDWLKVRGGTRSPLTATAWQRVKAEAAKAGMTPAEAVKTSAENSWKGFKADWVVKSGGHVGKQTALEARNRAVVERLKGLA